MNERYITFRSTKARKQSLGQSMNMTKNHGSDWSEVREYHEGDESRNIVWQKSREKTLFSREREENANFDIVLFICEESEGDSFCTPEYSISKKDCKKILEILFRESAQKNHHVYTLQSGISGKKYLKQRKIRNTLICIVDTEFDHFYTTLSHHNDVIFLHLIHPFEEHPEENLIFSGKSLVKKSYEKAWKTYRENLEKSVTSAGGNYIELYTHESIEKKMNYFFKNRYKKP